MRARLVALAVSLFTLPLFASVTGTVMNGDGQPIGGAKISLFAIETIEAQRARIVSATPQRTAIVTGQSDSKGAFKIEVPAGPATVQVVIEAKRFAPELFPAEREDDLGAITLGAAETKRGSVKAGGKPVAGATVLWTMGRLEALATTDAKGEYTVPDPSKWAARVVVLHPDYAPFTENANALTNQIKLDHNLDAGVAVQGKVVGVDGSTPVAKATILMEGMPVATTGDDGNFSIAHAPKKWETLEARSGNLAGIVARDSAKNGVKVKLAKGATIGGSVRDPKAQLPIAGAEVSISRQANGFAGSGPPFASAITDAKGNFTIGPLPTGAYQLNPSRPGYTMQGGPAAVNAGQTMQKAFVATRDARVSGMVVDEDKRPVAGAIVSPQNVSREAGMMMPRFNMMRSMRNAYSGPDGRYSVRADADVDVQVGATKKGWPAAKSSSLRLTAGERKTGVNITIPRGIAISGSVADKNGKALSGVAVTATEAEAGGGPGGGIRRQFVMGLGRNRDEDVVRTGSDGQFTMRLKEGTYDLNFRREGFADKNLRAQQVSAGTKPLEVTLEEGVEIVGRVTRAGRGVEEVNIGVISESKQAFVQTGPDGSFRLGDLSPGPMMLTVNKPTEFVQQMRPVTAPVRDLNIELPPGGTVRGNVVDKNTHQPVTSFQAGLTTSRSGGGMMIQTPPQMRSFTSDDGSFVLENVPTGPVEIVASAPGYTQGRVAGLTLEDGKPLNDVEVGLDTGVRVTGRVTGPDGAPLSGVTVRQDPFGGGGGRRPMRIGGPDTQTVTDANGEYAIEAVEPGEKTFEFAHSGLLSEQKTVTLSGHEQRVDAQLSSGTRLAGVVVTEGGVPVADASVRAMSAAASGGFGGRATQTDAGGGFQFEGLAPGHYTFSASKNGYADGTARDVDISSGAPVRITLKTGGTIFGHVSGLTDADLAHTTVEARGPNGSSEAPVDATGNYRIEGAPTGTVRVSAEVSQGFAQNRTSPLKSIQLEAGGAQQVDLAFLNETTIRGRVTANGKPLASAIVSFYPRSAKAQTNANATTDENGNYSVTGLQDAQYQVNVVDLQRLNPYSTTYDVNGSSNFDIDIRTAAVRGRVLDAGTGEPIADARVQVRKSGSDMPFAARMVATNANGDFTLEGVSSGNYTLSADKEGYGNELRDVLVSESGLNDVQLKLSPNSGITLRVVDARDGRLLSANVVVYDAQGRVVHDEPFRFGGSAEEIKLTLAPGSYRALVNAMGYSTQTVSLTSPSNQTVTLSPGGTLIVRSSSSSTQRARLIDGSGQAYTRPSSRQAVFLLDAAPGATTLQNVSPGSYTLQVLDGNDSVIRSATVVVVEGQTNTVDI